MSISWNGQRKASIGCASAVTAGNFDLICDEVPSAPKEYSHSRIRPPLLSWRNSIFLSAEYQPLELTMPPSMVSNSFRTNATNRMTLLSLKRCRHRLPPSSHVYICINPLCPLAYPHVVAHTAGSRVSAYNVYCIFLKISSIGRRTGGEERMIVRYWNGWRCTAGIDGSRLLEMVVDHLTTFWWYSTREKALVQFQAARSLFCFLFHLGVSLV